MEKEEVLPRDRSVQISKINGKYVLNKKKATKAEIKRREYITDGRKLYAQMFLQVYNSGDLDKMEAMLKKLCTPDITTIGVFENAPGDINPIGANSTETIGYSAHMSYTESFFKAAPDLVFEGEFDNAYIDPVTNIAISRCKMRIKGTRILDVKYDSKTPIENIRTTRKKRAVKKQVSKEENELMAQMHDLLASSYSNETPQESAWECDLLSAEACCSMEEEGSFMPLPASHETAQIPPSNHTTNTAPPQPPAPPLLPVVNLISQNSIDSTYPTTNITTTTTTTNPSTSTNSNSNTVSPKEKLKPRKRKGDESNTAPNDADIDDLTAKMSSLFAEREVMRLVDSDTLSVDVQPLEQSVAIDYGGTFTVYFNEQNKVCRAEWVYAQKQQQQQQSVGDCTSSEGDVVSEGEVGGLMMDAVGSNGTTAA